MRGRIAVFVGAAVLLALGLGLVLLAQSTPWHSSGEFYDLRRALEARAHSNENPDWDALSREFHALEDRYRTNKWLYADLGYLAIALSLLVILIAALVRPLSALLRSTHQGVLVGAMFLISYAGFWIGAAAANIHIFGRYQAPPWSDSLAMPLGGIAVGGPILAVVIAPFFLWPLFRAKTASQSLAFFDVATPFASALASVIYVPAGLGLAALAILSAASPGAWLVSPSLLILSWLAFNTRVLAIAPEVERIAGSSEPPVSQQA